MSHNVSGMSLKNSAFDNFFCCEVSKNSSTTATSIAKKDERKSSKLDLVFTDILGLLRLVAIDTLYLLRISTAGTQRTADDDP